MPRHRQSRADRAQVSLLRAERKAGRAEREPAAQASRQLRNIASRDGVAARLQHMSQPKHAAVGPRLQRDVQAATPAAWRRLGAPATEVRQPIRAQPYFAVGRAVPAHAKELG
eukprot:scaffold206489_cov28-Tisochrysis_lutea.AAC.4